VAAVAAASAAAGACCWLSRLGTSAASSGRSRLLSARSLASTVSSASPCPSVAFAPSPLVRGLLRRVEDCNDAAEAARSGRPLLIDGDDVGLVLPKAAAELERFPEVFKVTDRSVEMAPGVGSSAEARSEAVAAVLKEMRGSGRVPMLEGWRNEGWPVKASFDAPVRLVVERASGPLFGVRGFGCHVNGLVQRAGAAAEAEEPPCLWVARRAKTKQTYPGMLDHVVAGGLSHGERPGENVIRECLEEASIPAELARRARPAGVVSYSQRDETGWGVKRDVIFCYDLELPEDFKPQANDGEVESFELWDMNRVIESITGDSQEWKPNVALVIIDMFVRRGLLAPEEVGYVDLVRSLKS